MKFTLFSRRWLVLGGFVLICVLGLSVGLGVGLSGGKRSLHHSQPKVASDLKDTWWKPSQGITWQYQLAYSIDSTVPNVIVYDIDLFENSKTKITSLQDQNKKVICYFSAGSYEDWRPDKENFTESDFGKPLDGWKGERWLDVNSANVRNIMISRIELAAKKNCDGIEPDNVDGYDNDNGLGLTKNDAIKYLQFLSQESHSRNLSIGLKNSGDIVDSVVNIMDWCVQEQCLKYNECKKYKPFISASKPIFHVEYPKGDNTNNDKNVSKAQFNKICDDKSTSGFTTILKNMDLDYWIEICKINN